GAVGASERAAGVEAEEAAVLVDEPAVLAAPQPLPEPDERRREPRVRVGGDEDRLARPPRGAARHDQAPALGLATEELEHDLGPRGLVRAGLGVVRQPLLHAQRHDGPDVVAVDAGRDVGDRGGEDRVGERHDLLWRQRHVRSGGRRRRRRQQQGQRDRERARPHGASPAAPGRGATAAAPSVSPPVSLTSSPPRREANSIALVRRSAAGGASGVSAKRNSSASPVSVVPRTARSTWSLPGPASLKSATSGSEGRTLPSTSANAPASQVISVERPCRPRAALRRARSVTSPLTSVCGGVNVSAGGGGSTTLNVNSWNVDERSASETASVKRNVPSVVGVPCSTPPDSSRPGGSVPCSRRNSYGRRPPTACTGAR